MKHLPLLLVFLFTKLCFAQSEIPQNIKTSFTGTWFYEDNFHTNTIIIMFEKGKDYATFKDIGTGEAPTETLRAKVKGHLLVVPAQREKNDEIEMEIVKGKLHLRTRPAIWGRDGTILNNKSDHWAKRIFKRVKN